MASAVRYAPEDPTLPKPWKGLIDGSTGYLYFWNPETNVTQYERPASLPESLPPPPPNPPKTAMIATGSVQGKQSSAPSSHSQQRDMKEEDGRYGGPRSHQQHSTKTNTHSQSYANGSVNVGHGTSGVHSHVHAGHASKSSARGHGSSDAGAGLSAELYRRQHEISVMGDNVPSPLTTFESTGFPSEILKEVHHAGFSFPTPIQAQSWPIALHSRDVVAIAKTGSGKTLGYLIPGFIHLKRLHNNSRMGPTVLVLAPTRELATQIQEEAVKFGRSSRISCTCLYGGAPKGPQLRDLDRGADVVVATPGRLNDILEMRRISLRQVSYLVLDEADRMLDMGFEPQIRKIVKEVPARRQTLMFTATWPKEVRKIAADLLVHPVQVNIGNVDELVANSAVTQYIEVMTPMEKQRRLEQILRSQEPGSKVLIFCSTKRMCDQLARSLTRSFGAAAIHGDKSQSERDYVLGQFRTGRSPILVATDVAARGLDIKDIRVVVNYDFPTGVEDYVHRIGRTGRAGATGVAYTFFCDQDAKYASDLIKVLEGASQRVPSELRDLVRRGGHGKARSRWASVSGGRDGGRPLDGVRSDSGYGGSGAWGSSGGRSENARGGRGHADKEPPRDRYNQSHYGSHEDDERARYGSKVSVGNDNRRTGDRADKSGGRSRSKSPGPVVHGSLNDNRSPKRSRNDDTVGSRSRSRSRSRNHVHTGRSRSRSLDRHGGGESGRGWSPVPSKQSSLSQRTGDAHSAPSRHQQQSLHHSYYSSHEDDVRACSVKASAGNDNHQTEDLAGGRKRSRSRSPVRIHGNLDDNRSPKRGQSERPDRSRSRSMNRVHNGRSRSHSLDQYGADESGRPGWSPAAKESSPNQRTGDDHSPPSQYQQQSLQQDQYDGNDMEMHQQRSSSPYIGDRVQPQRSPSPYIGDTLQQQRSPSPDSARETRQWGSPTPHYEDGMREAAASDHTLKDKSTSSPKSTDDERPAYVSPRQQWPCSVQYDDGDDDDANTNILGEAPSQSSAPAHQAGEEEEEGIIPADEEGIIPAKEGRDHTQRLNPDN